jgi:hypothetical protein
MVESMDMDLRGLVALLYRADWTGLSLSASITEQRDPDVDDRLRMRAMEERRRRTGRMPPHRARPAAEVEPEEDDDPDDWNWRDWEQRVLLAPGGRYRVMAMDGSLWTVCDGETLWVIDEDGAMRSRADGPDSAFRGLFTPRWLLACYDLQITGNAVTGGRSAIAVRGTPRPLGPRRHGFYHLLDRVEVLVDAELGVLLRSEQIFEGQQLKTTALRNVLIDPAEAADPGQFGPPVGLPVTGEPDPVSFEPSGPAWQLAGSAASLAAAGMGFAVRHAPRRPTTWPSGDEEDDFAADAWVSAEDWARPQPPGDELVNLLYRTGLPAQQIAAELHQWTDGEAVMLRLDAARARIPSALNGILGPDAFWAALGERASESGTVHRVARLLVSAPDRYRLDHLSGDWRKRYQSIACDGDHTTKLFADRVATGPVKPLAARYAVLLDPSWLLSGWRLAAGGPRSVGGRAGYRLLAEAGQGLVRSGQPAEQVDTTAGRDQVFARDQIFGRMEVIVDTELGIVLRQTSYVGDRPAVRTELRGLAPLAPDVAGEFRIEPPPGMRVVTESGGPLADLNLPRVAEAAAAGATLAIGGAVAGAVAVTGWLEKHRARRADRR